MNIASLLQDSLGDALQDSVSSSAGVAKSDVSSVMKMALPLVTGALAKNTQSSTGAQALADALDHDHDGAVLDHLDQAGSESNTSTGNGILKHVLGDKRSGIEQTISDATGIDPAKVSMILAMVTPMIMGMLGKEKKEAGLDASGLSALLSSASGSITKDLDAGDLVSSILDKDGDGSMVDDVADMGMKAFGSMFK